MAQRQGHARSRPDGDETVRRRIHGGGDRHHAPPRRDLDAAPRARRCAGHRHRRDLGLLPDQRAGAAFARASADADLRRSLERCIPVPHRARDRHRLGARALHPHHLRRRARLRALHPGRAGHACLRPAGRGRRAVRAAPRRAEGAREPAAGERLSRLRPRHRQHRQRLRDRAWVLRRSEQAGLHRPRRGAARRRRRAR